MRNGPRNYWETDRLLLLGTQRRGRGRDFQVLILKIRRKEEEDEEEAEEEENNNNNNNNNSGSSKRPSACLRVSKITTIMRNVHTATGVFRKQERREMGDLLYLCVPVERILCT